MNQKKLISFVVPVFNEEENVLPMYNAIINLMDDLKNEYEYEIVITDNHSTDKTFDILKEIAVNDKRVKVIRFSRNFGYQRSIYTGYINSSGDVAVQLDCDLQDPLELIPTFLEHWLKGYKVVYGVRVSRKEGWWINNIRKVFYRLIDSLSEDHLPRDAGDFRLIDKQIIEQLRLTNDSAPYIRGSIASMGFEQIGIPYNRNERARGESKFSYKDLFRLAFDGILNHSTAPLRLASYTGLTISIITFLALIVYFSGKLLFGANWPAGFATTTILILLSLSLNALFLGIIGEYLGRIYLQVKKKPLTISEIELNTSDSQIK
ncbi:glycosyltransferase family 2 protein [Paenibacillus motobuensis]|uniref:glycosyltransferase family 2 protein n=1 Tax=Paenibacillus TaxID=44249 RepID=UPI0020423F67|nr:MULTISPECIES: glycosyltransferase family 2 protein [Paenibacillus]MCM3040837.1 glycosyltransferase family 2 protein [Paenibacillus lutimineralis]MCM3647941.1 glycosyltransferase family 2 protein [Paenibacillus motobuensis]